MRNSLIFKPSEPQLLYIQQCAPQLTSASHVLSQARSSQGALSIFSLIISFVGSLTSSSVLPIILLPLVTTLPNYQSTPPYQAPSFMQLLITFSFKLSLRASSKPSRFPLTLSQRPLKLSPTISSRRFLLLPATQSQNQVTCSEFLVWHHSISRPPNRL